MNVSQLFIQAQFSPIKNVVFYLHITNFKLPSIWDVDDTIFVECLVSYHSIPTPILSVLFSLPFVITFVSFFCVNSIIFLSIERADRTNLPSRFIFPLIKTLILMHCIVGWKFCKRWSMAWPHCRDKQCIWPPWVYCKGLVQSISDIQWAGIIGSFLLVNRNCPLPHPHHTHTHPSHKIYKWLPLCQCWHVKQESLVRVAVWCIGEYGDMLVNNIGMLDIEDPIVVSTLPMPFFSIFFFFFF